jgi:hypothetical protein
VELAAEKAAVEAELAVLRYGRAGGTRCRGLLGGRAEGSGRCVRVRVRGGFEHACVTCAWCVRCGCAGRRGVWGASMGCCGVTPATHIA